MYCGEQQMVVDRLSGKTRQSIQNGRRFYLLIRRPLAEGIAEGVGVQVDETSVFSQLPRLTGLLAS